jgi:uncharacterized protein
MTSFDNGLVHCARTPNVTIDIADIITKWSRPGSTFASEHMVAQTGRASNGAISWRASADSLTAPTLPPWYDGFEQFLEPGIRDLCLFFIRECGWITYTSCEGHEGIGAPSSLRHVGILPRDSQEYFEVAEFLDAVVNSFRISFHGASDISLGVLRHRLSDPTRSCDVLDIEFASLTGQKTYFSGIDDATAWLMPILREEFSQKVGMS